MRSIRFRPLVALLAPLVLVPGMTGCATAFSPAVIRGEIARQTGQDPRSVFELSLGRPTMALAKAVLAGSAPEGPLPLSGIDAFEIATYDVPRGGAELDFTRMPVRGWEPAVAFREGPRSALVVVHATPEAVEDLVIVAAGENRVVYARIRGRLSPALPDALGRTVRAEGPEAIQKELMSLSEPPR